MCYVRCLMIPVLTIAKAPWLLDDISGASTLVVPMTSFCSCVSHLVSLDTSEHAMYSASGVDAAAGSCFRDCHDIRPLYPSPRV